MARPHPISLAFLASLRARWGSPCPLPPSPGYLTPEPGMAPSSQTSSAQCCMSTSLHGRPYLSCPGQGPFSAPMSEARHPRATYNNHATCECVRHGLLDRCFYTKACLLSPARGSAWSQQWDQHSPSRSDAGGAGHGVRTQGPLPCPGPSVGGGQQRAAFQEHHRPL